MNTINELEKFYEKSADGVKICIKCNWYQYGEKSTKFFFNLEKKWVIGSTMKKLLNHQPPEITNAADIKLSLKNLFENLFKKKCNKGNSDIALLNSIQLSTISIESLNNCKSVVIEKNLLAALKSMPNNRTPGNDGFSKKIYKTFWDEIKGVFINSLRK